MVSRERLELSTPGLKGPCSNQLSYRPTTEPHCKNIIGDLFSVLVTSAGVVAKRPEGTRVD